MLYSRNLKLCYPSERFLELINIIHDFINIYKENIRRKTYWYYIIFSFVFVLYTNIWWYNTKMLFGLIQHKCHFKSNIRQRKYFSFIVVAEEASDIPNAINVTLKLNLSEIWQGSKFVCIVFILLWNHLKSFVPSRLWSNLFCNPTTKYCSLKPFI